MGTFEDYYKSLQSSQPSSQTATDNAPHDDFNKYYDSLKMDIGSIPDTRPKVPDPSLDSIMSSQHQTENSVGYNPQPFSNEPVQPQQPSPWQGILNNPIVHGAETAFDYAVNKPLQTVATAVADVAGAGNNLFTKPQQGYNGETIQPSESHNLLKDIASIWSGNGSDVAHNAMEGAFPNDFSKNLPGTNISLGNIEENAAQFADLSPLLKGAQLGASKIGDAFDAMFGRIKPSEAAPIEQAQPILGLPEPRSAQRLRDAQQSSILEPNTSPIYGQGDVQTLGLPEGDYTPTTRLKVSNPDETLSYVMGKIKPEVMQTIEAPARRDLLINYIQKNTQYPIEDIHNRPMAELQQYGQVIQQDLHAKMPQIAAQVAAKYGHDLPSLLEGQAPNLRAQIAKDAQIQVYGVPARSVGLQKPSFNIQHVADAAMPETKVKLSDARGTKLSESKKVTDSTQPKLSDLKAPTKLSQSALPKDELKFAETVRNSPTTPPDIVKALEDKPLLGARTTDIKDRQEAAALIKKHGIEGLHTLLMNKTKQFSSAETVAAKVISDHFGTLGGDGNLTKALDLVAKTGKGSREMGQAISALRQWKQLDASGVTMLGTKELNRGVKDIKDYKALTPAQSKTLTEPAARMTTADETKSLADEVLHIVTNKQAGEALTDAEKATIKQFNDQVKSINDKTKPFLPQEKGVKANATIKEVSQIEPKARTRDQVVSFLDAKAEKARQRIAASRQMGFAAVNKGNPAIDYAIIGASHIAKGVVKLSDFTEQMVKDFGESVKPHINEAFTMATNIFRKENGLPTIEALDRVVNKAVKDERFTPEDAANFKAWASEIGHYADHNLKVEATQDLQAAMKDLGDSTLGQKVATVQTGSMLLNNVTIERNVLGNAAQLIGDKVSKMVTVPIDFTVSKLTGEQRTIVFNQMNQEKFWKNFMIGTKSGWKGVSPNGQLDSYGVHPNVFGKNNPLKYITKLLGASLQGFDHAFYSSAKGEVLATYAEQLGKAQGLTRAEIKSSMKDLIVQLDDRIHELADHAGKYATYQDETMLSKGAEMLRKGLNEATTGALSRALVEKGMPKKYSLEGFGAGDVLVKFAKTPANLVMRGMDYSPIGFIRSIMDLGTFVLKREKFNQHEAVRSLGRAITGTLGFTGMGYILADAGILTGSASMDKDVRSIQEQSGQGAYKVNWSALGRFFKSGFSYDAAAYQKGDHLMDYQWLQPAAISVAMGVNANKSVQAHKAGDSTAGWQMAGKALLGGIQTVLENPMVQGLSSVIDAGSDIIKKQDPTKLINIAKGVPASFVPTLLNQARQSVDNNQRETFDKSPLTEIGNMMANKVPGLSSKLPISYDSMGNAREKLQGGQANTVAQYLTSFFSPAKMTEYQVSPEAKMVLDLMNQSGDATILPRIADKSFHVSQGKQLKDLKVSLTKEQFSQLQQETGKMVTEKLSQQADYLANPNVALQHKVDKVKQILSDVGKKAKQDIGVQMGYQKSKVKS